MGTFGGWRPGCGMAAAALGFLLSAPAAAAVGMTVEIDGDGLRMDLAAAPHCLIWPHALQVKSDCPGVNLDAAEATFGVSLANAGDVIPVAFVTWRLEGGVVQMIVVSAPPGVPTAKVIADTLAGFYNTLHPDEKVTRRNDPKLDHDELSIAGTPAVRYQPRMAAGGRGLVYFVFGANRQYQFMFQASAPGDVNVRALADRVMAGVALPALPPDETSNDVPTENQFAYRLGTLIGALLVTGLVSRLMGRLFSRTVVGAVETFGASAAVFAFLGLVSRGRYAVVELIGLAVWLLFDLGRAIFRET